MARAANFRSFRFVHWALAIEQGLDGRTLQSADKAVLLCLAGHADWNTGKTAVRQGTLGREMGLSEKTVCRALLRLEQGGLISRRKRGVQGMRIADEITLWGPPLTDTVSGSEPPTNGHPDFTNGHRDRSLTDTVTEGEQVLSKQVLVTGLSQGEGSKERISAIRKELWSIMPGMSVKNAKIAEAERELGEVLATVLADDLLAAARAYAADPQTRFPNAVHTWLLNRQFEPYLPGASNGPTRRRSPGEEKMDAIAAAMAGAIREREGSDGFEADAEVIDITEFREVRR